MRTIASIVKRGLMGLYGLGVPFCLVEFISRRLRRFTAFRNG